MGLDPPSAANQGGWGVVAGSLGAGEAKTFRASSGLLPVQLPNAGGLITLLNDKGERVDRVDYTKRDVQRAKGLPIFFPVYRS